MCEPQFPIFIVSKGRADTRLTAKSLEEINISYRIIVEEQERESYESVIGPMGKVVVLDPEYQRQYDTFDELGDSKSKGPGPARNFVWDLATSEGHAWHWVMDDNIRGFWRLHRNRKIRFGDPSFFRYMEDFCLRYTNVAMAGPNYYMFAPKREKQAPFVANTRIYSCNLIRNAVPFRWRGRYNEDTDLSLRMLKAGWCTIQFNAFLQQKMVTQALKGGNTEAFYAIEGTHPKSEMLVRMHPDVARMTHRFGRTHHYVDYRPFRKNLLKRADSLVDFDCFEPYELVEVTEKK